MNTRMITERIDSYAKTPVAGRSATQGDYLVNELAKQRKSVEAAITTLQGELQELEFAGEKLFDLIEVE